MIKPYADIQTTVVSNDVFNEAFNYAYAVEKTKRNGIYKRQNDFNKIISDHLYGKISEQAAYQVLKNYDCKISKPDFEVHTTPSWDSDLTNFMGNNIAIKSQNVPSTKAFGISWVFQRNLTQRFDPILNSPDAWICFVLCGIIKPIKCMVLPLFQIKEITFREPDLTHLIGDKVCVCSEKLPGINLNVKNILSILNNEQSDIVKKFDEDDLF